MDTLSAIKERRSVKYYDPEHVITENELRQLLENALLAPTSFNMQNWRFVAVTDAETKESLRAASFNQAQVSEASVTIVLCADLDAHENAERYWKDAPESVKAAIVPMIGQFYDGKEVLQRDEAMRSVGIAGQTIMLAAKAMGYDSCPMIGFDANKVAEIINLPERHIIGMMVTVGKAIKPANPRPGQLPYESVVVRTRF